MTILLLACVLGVVAYRKWALGVAGVLLMGAVIIVSVVTRASVKPLDAGPVPARHRRRADRAPAPRRRLWRMHAWPDTAADLAAKEPERPAASRRPSSRDRPHRGGLGRSPQPAAGC